MEKELRAFTDGTYVFQETEKEGKFFFYRQDGGVLENIDREPFDMYQNYICMKMMNGEIDGAVFGNVCSSISEDGKVMLLSSSMEKIDIDTNIKSTPAVKKENPVKRMIKSIFTTKNK